MSALIPVQIITQQDVKDPSFVDWIFDVETEWELTPSARQWVAEYTSRFEECSNSEEELLQLADKALVEKMYWVMRDYCS